jgi:hypothetical protein
VTAPRLKVGAYGTLSVEMPMADGRMVDRELTHAEARALAASLAEAGFGVAPKQVPAGVTPAIADGTSQPWTPPADLAAEVDRLTRELAKQRDFAADCARADKAMGRELIEQRDEARAEHDEVCAALGIDQSSTAAGVVAEIERLAGTLRLVRREEQRAAHDRDLARAACVTEREAMATLRPSVTTLHQVAQVLGVPIGQDLTHPTMGVVAKVKDALAQRHSAFACGRELIKERDAMRDRMREAERQLENEKQARFNAEAALSEERERWAPALRSGFRDAEAMLDAMVDQGEQATELRARLVSADEALEAARGELAQVRIDRDHYREKHAEWTRGFVAIMQAAMASGLRLPTDTEEAGGRDIVSFVREIATGYKQACLALAMLQTERDVRVGEVASYRRAVCFEMSCLHCAQRLEQMHRYHETVRALVESLPRCSVDLDPPLGSRYCSAPATCDYGRGTEPYCDNHRPTADCPDQPSASAVRQALDLLAGVSPDGGAIDRFVWAAIALCEGYGQPGDDEAVERLRQALRGVPEPGPTEAERLASLLEAERQHLSLARATAETDRRHRDDAEAKLNELRRVGRAAFDGWARGNDVGGPMVTLRDALDRLDEAAVPGIMPTPVETYRRALGFWGLVLGYEPGRQLNEMVYHVLGDERAKPPPRLLRLSRDLHPSTGERALDETIRRALAMVNGSNEGRVS